MLLENRGELPWDPARLRSVAVIRNVGNVRTRAAAARPSCQITVSPLDGLRAALPGVDVTYSRGAVVQEGVVELPLAQMTNPVTGEPGLRARFLDSGGTELFAEDRRSSALVWFGDAPIGRSAMVELATRFTPAESGGPRWLRRRRTRQGVHRRRVLVDEIAESEHTDLGAALMAPPTAAAEVHLTAGTPANCASSTTSRAAPARWPNCCGCGSAPSPRWWAPMLSSPPRRRRPGRLTSRWSSSAPTPRWSPRATTAPRFAARPPDNLVRAVAAANPHTVVLVNAGSPVLMPWRDQVAAVLIGYFGGQEFGHAVADMLLGAAELGGRLPTTWPAAEANAIMSTAPVNGALDYAEGIHIGYRAWLKQDAAPAYSFGSGQGYTDIAVTSMSAPPSVTAGEALPVTVEVENCGTRDGKQIVQIYAERADSAVDRPVRWLVGFAPVRVPAGEKTRLEMSVPTRMLAYWQDGWRYEPGAYQFRAGTSAVDLPLAVEVEAA